MLKKILSNSAALLSAQLFIKATSFLYTIFLARALGVVEFGVFITALAYFSLSTAIADFGFNRFLIKEGVKSEKQFPDFLGASLIIRLFLTTLLFIIFLIWFLLSETDTNKTSILLIAVLAVLPQSVGLTLDAALISKERIKYSSLALICLSLFTCFLGILFVTLGFGSRGAVYALVLGQFLYVFVQAILVHISGMHIFVKRFKSVFRVVLKNSLPFGLLGIIGLISFKIDTIFLNVTRGDIETSLYGLSYRFLEAVIFIPSAITVVLFPIIAKSIDNNIGKVKEIYFKSLFVLGGAGVIIALLYILILPFVIPLILPSYINALFSIKILAIALPFIFMHIPSAQILLSSEKYLKETLIMYFGLLLWNLLLMYLFIPTYGYIAASVITVFSEITTFVVFFLFLKFRIFKDGRR